MFYVFLLMMLTSTFANNNIYLVNIGWVKWVDVLKWSFSSIIMALDQNINDLFVKYKKNKD